MNAMPIWLQILLILFSVYLVISVLLYYLQDYFLFKPEKLPKDFKINAESLQEAVTFAESNEYSGSRDLRIAILKGFEREPFQEILY